MENNEIMFEEVMDVTEEIADVGSGKSLSAGKVIGVAALVGGAIALSYKFVAKPVIAKIKAKKEAKNATVEVEHTEIVNDCDEE